MRYHNPTTKRSYLVLKAKLQDIMRWCHLVKPSTIKLDGVTCKVYSSREYSNYIYITGLKVDGKPWAHVVWCKDATNWDFLKEKSLKSVGKLRTKSTTPSAAKAGVKGNRKPREVEVIKQEKPETAEPKS